MEREGERLESLCKRRPTTAYGDGENDVGEERNGEREGDVSNWDEWKMEATLGDDGEKKWESGELQFQHRFSVCELLKHSSHGGK